MQVSEHVKISNNNNNNSNNINNNINNTNNNLYPKLTNIYHNSCTSKLLNFINKYQKIKPSHLLNQKPPQTSTNNNN